MMMKTIVEAESLYSWTFVLRFQTVSVLAAWFWTRGPLSAPF